MHVTARLSSLWRFFRKVIAHDPPLFALSLAIGLINGMLEGVGLFLLIPLLSFLGLGEDGGTEGDIAGYFGSVLHALGLAVTLESVLALFLCLMLARGLLNWLQADANARLTNGFLCALRIETYNGLTGAGWQHLARKRSSELAQAVTAQADELATGAMLFLLLITSALSITAGIAVAFSVAPLLTVAAVVSAAAMVLPMMVFDLRAYRIGMRAWASMKDIYEQLSRHLAGLKAARVLSVEDRYRGEFAGMARRYGDIGVSLARNSATASLIHSLAGAIVLCILVFVAAKSGSSSIQPILLVVIFSRLLPRFQSSQSDFRQLLEILPQYEAFSAQLDEAHATTETQGQETASFRLVRQIKLEDLSFRYADTLPLVLDGVNLTIPARGAIGVVGASGSGKTTLVDILAGMLMPTHGHVTIDGVTLTAPLLAAWRRRIAYVTQEEFLFDDSIRANLTLAAPENEPDRIWTALEAARAADLVRSLPAGLETTIGDRGTRLSRGQRQRLCLARALLATPDLLILDEATSALNPVDEREILAAIRETAHQRAVVVVAHRISTVSWTDRIVVMGHGKVLEDGRFADLVRRPSSLVHAMSALERSEAGVDPGVGRDDHAADG
ncbi:MAG: ABC transporter ATP-binding protein [Hyphomicrobiales bacterium]